MNCIVIHIHMHAFVGGYVSISVDMYLRGELWSHGVKMFSFSNYCHTIFQK